MEPKDLAPSQLLMHNAAELDAQDELAPFREQFYLPPDRIYLDGNSLGLLCKPAETALLRALEQWRRLAIEGWLDAEPPWFYLAEEVARLTAPLIGAEPEAVIAANSTTVNLHQLLATLFRPKPGRDRILADALAFPSDIHAIQSHLRLRGLDPQQHLVRVPSPDGRTLDEDALIAAMDARVALAVLPSVVYTSGQLLDLPRLIGAARERGVLLGFDCSHSVGAVSHQLQEWGADFAFWCGYKYLNGGPGAAGGLYVHPRHWEKKPGLAGWFGSDKTRQFEMAHAFTPAGHAGALQIGSPHVLSLAPLLGSLAVLQEAGLERLRRKSLRLTDCLMQWADQELAPLDFSVVTPREPERRGGHVALAHPEAASICRALREAGVVPDFRPPDLIRLAPVPLYNTFSECRKAVDRLRRIVAEGRHRGMAPGRDLIT